MIDNLPDAITEIVEDMQAVTVSSETVLATSTTLTFTYNATNNIYKAGMYVEFSSPSTYAGNRYKIHTLTKNSANNYTITVSADLSDLDGIKLVYMHPFLNFKYDSWKNIQKRLIEETRDSGIKKNKYPLLCLIIPVKEDHGKEPGIIFETSSNFVFIVDSHKNYTTAERHTYSMKQKLYPLYDLFLEKLQNSALFQTDENFLINHSKEDLYFFASDEAKSQNKLAAVVDAIEITNLNLILNKQSKC